IGNEIFIGDDGIDTFSALGYDESMNEVYPLDFGQEYLINLATGEARLALDGAWTGSVLLATLSGVENIVGSDGRDTLIGDGGDNVIDGGRADDAIEGAGGDDTLTGGAGADTLDGGDGVDAASYQTSAAAIQVDLAAQTAHGGDAEGDVLTD